MQASPFAASFDDHDRPALFLVWGPPSHGPRSKVLARELGIEGLHYIYGTRRRGLLVAPLKYGYQALRTICLFARKRPRIVFVQSPPSFAVLFVHIYCLLTHARYIVDAHSDALQRRIWTWPGVLYRWQARGAITTIVTNEHLRDMIEQRGGKAFILRDVPTRFVARGDYPLHGDFNIAVVNSFAKDEPLGEVLEAARNLPEVHFYITGRKPVASHDLSNATSNVHFTDFLPDEQYYALLAACQAVMCLTTRDHTMQRGACEALSLGKPIVTSDWPVLRTYFSKGTVHVLNTRHAIREGVLQMQRHYAQFLVEIEELQRAKQEEWHSKRDALLSLVQAAVTNGQPASPHELRPPTNAVSNDH